jgi:leader peptidase (prepilin peptidase)/N-methyltransferase
MTFPPTWLIVIVFGCFGLVVGSFLNVCIYRIPRRESIVWPASRCPSCARALAWYENVPVLSYGVLRGRCRTCRVRIGVVYPLVEIVTGFAFVACALVFGLTALACVRILFSCLLIVLFAIDLEHQILPNVITLPGIVRWLPEAAANAVLHGASPAATTLSAGAALAALAGYAAVLAGAGAALTVRREIGTTTG